MNQCGNEPDLFSSALSWASKYLMKEADENEMAINGGMLARPTCENIH